MNDTTDGQHTKFMRENTLAKKPQTTETLELLNLILSYEILKYDYKLYLKKTKSGA